MARTSPTNAGRRHATVLRTLLALAALAAAAGCAESSRPTATGEGWIRGMNALIDSPDVQFLIEETNLAVLSYKDSSAERRYDDLSYTFNFDIRVPGEALNRRLARQLIDVVADNEYLLVLAGTVTNPEVIVWDNPDRVWADTETVFEVSFGHATRVFADVDVYFAAPGTAPLPGNQVATLGFGERSDIREYPAGQYEVTLTPANDPATVLYRSVTAEYPGGGSNVIIIVEGDPSTPSPVNARLIPDTGAGVELPDVQIQPTLRFLHGAFPAGNLDVARNDDFVNLLASDLAFASVSPDVSVPAGSATINWVPAGNTTPVFSDENRLTAPGSRVIHMFLGEPGNYGVVGLPSVRRGFSTSARMRFTNGNVNVDERIDVYLAAPGRPLTEVAPVAAFLPFSQSSGFQTIQSGDYELTVTRFPSREDILAGPIPVSVQNGDVVDVVVLDTADPNVSDVLIFDSVP